jgi:hypothetical protein
LKKRMRKILTGTSVPLDLPANGRPVVVGTSTGNCRKSG